MVKVILAWPTSVLCKKQPDFITTQDSDMGFFLFSPWLEAQRHSR